MCLGVFFVFFSDPTDSIYDVPSSLLKMMSDHTSGKSCFMLLSLFTQSTCLCFLTYPYKTATAASISAMCNSCDHFNICMSVVAEEQLEDGPYWRI